MNLNELFYNPSKLINEGGNLELPGGHAAQQIDLKVHNRSYIVPILDNLLKSINDAFKKQFKHDLWSTQLLQKKEFLSGSSLHFFNTKGIPDETFIAKKPKVGDIDTQVNKEHEEELEKFLTMAQGKKVGPGVCLGFQRGNEQFSSLWELSEPPIKIQIDLEFVQFDQDEPTAWSKFSHSSSWDDLEAGIKGVFHKFLIQSFGSLTRREFLLRKSVGRGKAKELQDIPTTDNMVSFAVSSKEGGGLRAKYAPVLDDAGNPIEKDGLPVMQALPAAGYEQNIDKIFATLFGKRMSPKQAQQLQQNFWSFVGLAKAMNTLLDDNEKQQVIDVFISKIFDKGAQGLYKNDPDRDTAEKSAALNKLLEITGVRPPADLEQKKAAYKSSYKMTESINEAPNYKRQGIQHIYAPGSSTEMKDLEFVEMCKEIAENGGKLDGMAINLKADGAGIRFGKDESGRPFFMTSKVTEPKYADNIGDFEQFGLSQGQTPERLAFTKKYDDAMSIILNSDFIKALPNDTIVQSEMMYNDMAQKTPQGLKFVNIPYDQKKLGKTMTLVPFMFKTFSTGEARPDADAIKKKLLSMSDNNIKFVNNQLEQKGIDVRKIIAPVVNMDQSLLAALSSRTRNNPGKEQAKEIITQTRQQLSQAIIENPNIKGKDQLGDNIEGLVINLPSGRLAKVTSQLMKDSMAAKKAAPAKQGPTKTAVVAIGSFVGHKGHQELFKLTVDKAKELGGDPFLFMGNAVGKDDPIPVADKIKTWRQLYPQYSKNIGATQEGGSLMQKIKHELVNPTPGKPPKYDNIVIMVGEDQANMPIANAVMKAVNKFPGYEHVKVQLEVTPRGTGMSFTQLRNALKTGDDASAFNLWNDAFNGGNFGAQKLPSDWIQHLMNTARTGMGINNKPKVSERLFNALTNPITESYPFASKQQKPGDQVKGKEAAKNIGPILGAKSKKHPFDGRLVGEAQGAISEDSIRPKLAAALTELGFKGPFKLGQLPKWMAELQDGRFDKDTSIMIGGDDPNYDPWVAKGYDYGYAYGMETGYQTGLSAQEVFKQAKADMSSQGMAEGDRPGMKDGRPYSDPLRRHPGNDSYMTPEYLIQKYQDELKKIAAGPYKRSKDVAMYQARIAKLQRQQGVAEDSDSEELADEVYAEFERTYPNLARRADERTIHAAIIDVLNYGGDSNPSALAQDVARAVKRNMQQGVSEGKKPEHNLGTGWMLAKDKELGKKVAQNIDKARREKELMQKYAGKKDVAEVSKSTLDRYVTKAVDSHGHADFAARQSKDDPSKRSYHVDQKKTAEKRRQGISRALDRMSKESMAEETSPAVHRISVTVIDPNHPMVSKRKTEIQKTIRITQKVSDRDAAVNQAIAYYRRQGYKVLDHNYVGVIDNNVKEADSAVIAHTAKDLANPDTAKIMKHRARRDQEREQQLKGRNIAKRDQSEKDEWGNYKGEGVEEARQSAQVKLAKAWDRQQAKSAASRERAKELLNPPKKDEKEKEVKATEEKQRLDPKCWKGYRKQGTKTKDGVRVNNCVKVGESWENELALAIVKLIERKL